MVRLVELQLNILTVGPNALDPKQISLRSVSATPFYTSYWRTRLALYQPHIGRILNLITEYFWRLCREVSILSSGEW